MIWTRENLLEGCRNPKSGDAPEMISPGAVFQCGGAKLCLEILSSAIRGEFPSQKTCHGSGGPQDGPLNSILCPGLGPGLPKEQAVPDRTPSLQDGSLLPPPGEPREVTFERAAQADFSKMR